jgi:hypothetical protein
MLCVNYYTQDYIDGCHANNNLQLSTYDSLIAAARKQSGPDASQINAASNLLSMTSSTTWFWSWITIFVTQAGRWKARTEILQMK